MDTLNKFGFNIQESWQMPLVKAVEAQTELPKLRATTQPRPAVVNNYSNGGNSNYRTYGRR